MMQFIPNITIRDLPESAAIDTAIKDKIEKLAQFHDGIIACNVVVEQSQKKQHQGKLYKVNINLTVPKGELVVNKVEDEDVYVAIRDAFNAMRRQVQDKVNIQQGKVKVHELVLHGTIVRLFADEGYGFIESGGEEYYFSFANVTEQGFDKLDIGVEVQFIPVTGADGLQANRVTVGKHHPPL